MYIGPLLFVQFHCTKLVCHRIFLSIYSFFQNQWCNQCPFSLTWKRWGKNFDFWNHHIRSPLIAAGEKETLNEVFTSLQFLIFGTKVYLLLTVLFVFRRFNLLWFGVCLFLERNRCISMVIGRRAAWGCPRGMPSKASSGSILCSTFCFSVLSWFVRVWAALENTVPGKKSNNKTSLPFHLRQQSTKRLLLKK